MTTLEQQLTAREVVLSDEKTAAIGCLSISGGISGSALIEAGQQFVAEDVESAQQWLQDMFPNDLEMAAYKKANEKRYSQGREDICKRKYGTDAAYFYTQVDNASATVASKFDSVRST